MPASVSAGKLLAATSEAEATPTPARGLRKAAPQLRARLLRLGAVVGVTGVLIAAVQLFRWGSKDALPEGAELQAYYVALLAAAATAVFVLFLEVRDGWQARRLRLAEADGAEGAKSEDEAGAEQMQPEGGASAVERAEASDERRRVLSRLPLDLPPLFSPRTPREVPSLAGVTVQRPKVRQLRSDLQPRPPGSRRWNEPARLRRQGGEHSEAEEEEEEQEEDTEEDESEGCEDLDEHTPVKRLPPPTPLLPGSEPSQLRGPAPGQALGVSRLAPMPVPKPAAPDSPERQSAGGPGPAKVAPPPPPPEFFDMLPVVPQEPPARRVPRTPRRVGGLQVFLHIYDVSQEKGVQRLNSMLAHRLSPLKLGGLFHAGVEIAGREFSYGYAATGSGVGINKPKKHPCHHFRETCHLARTRLDEDEVLQAVQSLAENYPGVGYHLIRKNCCTFAADLCERLGVGPIPPWVYRLARIGESMLSASEGLEETVKVVRLSRSAAEVGGVERLAAHCRSLSTPDPLCPADKKVG